MSGKQYNNSGGNSNQQSRGGGQSYHQGRGGGQSYQQGRGGGQSYHQGRGGGQSYQQGRGGGQSYQQGRGGGQSYQQGRGGGQGYGGSNSNSRGGYTEQSSMKIETVQAVDTLKRKFVGTLGNKIRLIVNYFSLNYATQQTLSGYRIDISLLGKNDSKREIKKKSSIRNLFWKFVKANGALFCSAFNNIFDDSHLLYCLKPLQFAGNTKELILEEQNNGKIQKVVMEIKKTRLYQLDNNILNLLISQYARCPIESLSGHVYCEIDRIYFRLCNDYRPLDLNFAFCMLKGVQATVKKGPAGVALANFDVTHSGFYKANVDILAFYVFVKTGREMGRDDLQRLKGNYSLNFNQRRELRSLLSGLMLKTKVGVITNYRFTDVSDKTAKNTHFIYKVFNDKGQVVREEEVTVQRYYETKYGKKLDFPDMPLIQCGKRDKNLLFPMEVLMLHDDLQRLRAKLPESLIALTNRFTTKEPQFRFGDIAKMMNDLNVCNNDPFMKTADVKVDPKFLEITGRVLPTPDCNFSKPFGFLMKAPAVAPPDREVVFTLIIVNNSIRVDENTKRAFNTLVSDCQKRGMRFATTGPLKVEQYSFNKQTLGDLIHKCSLYSLSAYPKAIPMIIFVVPVQDNQIYDCVKTECEINVGILSQVLLSRTFGKMSERPELQNSVTRNIFLKLNAKMGGVNNRIMRTPATDANWAKFTDARAPTLFVGIDVTHQAPGDTEFPSIASVVSNLDIQATRYSASVRVQMVRTEEIIDMKELCKERIYEFKKANNVLPAHIVIFRDGVSEGQFDIVINMELAAMRHACTELQKGYSPNFTIVIVQKRHSTRFYAPDSNVDGVNKGNVPPGTVLDCYITDENVKFKEFFLCPHKGMLGTSRPIHCYVIFDDWGLSANDLELCTYNLCYLFARAPMAVSLPAPVFYAHLCCYRARRHFSAQRFEGDRPSDTQRMVTVSERIRNYMYFC